MGVWLKVDRRERQLTLAREVHPPREMPQLSPILEVEQDSQTTSSVLSDTPPTLQPVTISPYACVTLDTQRADSQHRDYIDARCRRPAHINTTNTNNLNDKSSFDDHTYLLSCTRFRDIAVDRSEIAIGLLG